jgi:hypothetical protein
MRAVDRTLWFVVAAWCSGPVLGRCGHALRTQAQKEKPRKMRGCVSDGGKKYRCVRFTFSFVSRQQQQQITRD